MTESMVQVRKQKKANKKHATKDAAFKNYLLVDKNDGGQAILYGRKIVITSGAKIALKRKIKYNKILDMAKTGKNSVTIIYGVQARTLFFKDDGVLNEFFNLVHSLILSSTATPTLGSPPKTLLFSPQIKNPLAASASTDPATVAADKRAFAQLAVRQDLRRGDVVVAEGDLYQRIYTVAAGELHMKTATDRTFVTIQEGEVFGVLTLFHLRPSNVTIEVASETATLLIIPSYRIQELVTLNFPLAVRMHKKAAQLVYGQIERILLSREGPVTGFSPSGVFL
jgi:hypothetical protein